MAWTCLDPELLFRIHCGEKDFLPLLSRGSSLLSEALLSQCCLYKVLLQVVEG